MVKCATEGARLHRVSIDVEEREKERERGSNLRAAAPSQPDCPGVSRSDHSAGSKESASWRALELRSDWHGRLGVGKREKEGKETKARHEADSFEPAEWSERLTPGQSGWLGAAAVGSIPAPALSLFLQRLYFLLFLQRLNFSLRAVHSAAFLLFVLRRFVLAASSACFFPFFLPLPNPQSTVSVRT